MQFLRSGGLWSNKNDTIIQCEQGQQERYYRRISQEW